MTRRDPFREIEELFERMSREFEELGGTVDGPMPPLSTDVAVDVAEDDESVIVTADLPGYDREEIDVELREDALTIAASQAEESDVATGNADATDDDTDGSGKNAAVEDDEGDDRRYHVRERQSRSVSRRVPLPVTVEHDGASASYTNGVLTVTLPKRSATDSDGHAIDVN